MSEQPTIVVRGEALREVPPEIAVISVTVSARDADRQVTLTQLTERAAGLRQVLAGFEQATERVESQAVHIWPDVKRGGKVVAYEGSATTSVTVTDFEVLGDLLLQLGDQDQASVAGPWWQLRRGSRAGAEVRTEAIEDALQRAHEYAAAVGARVDRLVEIADEGTGGAQPMMHRAAYAKAEVADLSLDLDPAPQTVQASVVVRVAITHPDRFRSPS